jgi:hypothetical protein
MDTLTVFVSASALDVPPVAGVLLSGLGLSHMLQRGASCNVNIW